MVELGEFRVLGNVEVWAGGTRVDIGSARSRSVLAVLLVDANQVVRTGRLVERVWGERPPHTARGTLASYVSRLRKAISAEAHPGSTGRVPRIHRGSEVI